MTSTAQSDQHDPSTATQQSGATGKRRAYAHKSSWLMLVVLWLVYAMNANIANIIFPTSTLVAEEFALTPSELGLIVSVFFVARGFLAPFLATWIDRGGQGWARKYRQIVVAAVYLGSCFLVGFNWISGALGVFLALSIIRMLASGVGEAIEVTAVSEWWPRNRRGFAQGAHHTAFPWGGFLGSQVIALILYLTDNNWRLSYFVFPILGIGFIALYWVTSTRTRFRDVVQFAEAHGDDMAVDDSAAETKAAPGAFGRALRNPNVHLAGVSAGLQLMLYWGISTWIPLYLVYIGNFTAAAAASAGFLFTLTGGAGQIGWGAVSDRIGRKRVIMICCVWLMISVELLRFMTASTTALVLFQLLLGVCANAVYPVLYAWGSDSSERGAVGISNSIQIFYGGVGALMPLLIGVFIEQGGGYESADGYIFSLHIMAACELACLVVVALFMRESVGPRRGRDFALVSFKSCNIEPAQSGSATANDVARTE